MNNHEKAALVDAIIAGLMVMTTLIFVVAILVGG